MMYAFWYIETEIFFIPSQSLTKGQHTWLCVERPHCEQKLVFFPLNFTISLRLHGIFRFRLSVDLSFNAE